MTRRLTMAARRTLLTQHQERYRLGTRAERSRILDDLIGVTGHHRKHAIRLLNGALPAPSSCKGTQRFAFSEALREALVLLWKASHQLCGKRLRLVLPQLVSSLERHGHLRLEATVRRRVLSASAATLDRILATSRTKAGDRTSSALLVPPVRRLTVVPDPDDQRSWRPGTIVADLVCHGGASAAKTFVHTLTFTDLASGWTECVAIPSRDFTWVMDAMHQLVNRLPFRVRSFEHRSRGSFIREAVEEYGAANGLPCTQSGRNYRPPKGRAGRNDSVVRRLVHCVPLTGFAASDLLSRVHVASGRFANFFAPAARPNSSTALQHAACGLPPGAETPCARLLTSSDVPREAGDRLRAVADRLDPLVLVGEIRSLQERLAAHAAASSASVPLHSTNRFDRDSVEIVQHSEVDGVRPAFDFDVCRSDGRRTREDPFATAWPQIAAWLEREPDCSVIEILRRLKSVSGDRFADGQLRTLQRRIRQWRRIRASAREAVRRLGAAAL